MTLVTKKVLLSNNPNYRSLITITCNTEVTISSNLSENKIVMRRNVRKKVYLPGIK